MPAISIKNINKTYIDQDGNEVQALHDINLDVAEGEFVCTITRAVPNGCDRESAAKSVDIIRSLLYVSPPNSRFWACNGAAATQAASNIMILRFIHYLCFIVD